MQNHVATCNPNPIDNPKTLSLETKTKSCDSGSWDFGFHITEIEGLLKKPGNPRQEKNNVKVYYPWISTYCILRKVLEVCSLALRLDWNFDYWELNRC